MNKFLYWSLVLFLFISCETEIKDDVINVPNNVGELVHYEILFDESEFSIKEHSEILKELDVCDTLIGEDAICASCTPDFFKIIPFREDKVVKDAFLMQVKALTVMKGQEEKLPMRHLIAFERENGKLVKVNGFRGNLIASRISESGVNDLVIRFYIPSEKAFFNCLFLWSGKKYRFESVEAIDGNGGNGPIKASMKDEISRDIYQLLMSNTLLF